MDIVQVVLIALGLSMDAFAVSVTNGIMLERLKIRDAVKSSFFFGFFQFMMPIIGYVLGKTLTGYITSYDHWVAFALLGFIGGKMIYEGLKKDDDDEGNAKDILSVRNLTMLAIATSIDAAAVGITFAITNANIFLSCAVIGVITFSLCMVGILLGKKLGDRFKNGSEIFGGVILIFIGLMILNEHLMIF